MKYFSDPTRLPALMTYGYFTVSIFHNIANQIMQLQCDLQKAEPELSINSYRELQTQLNFVAEVIRHSQRIMSRNQPELICFNLANLLWKTKQLCNYSLMRSRVQCRIYCPPDLKLVADPVILQQILMNLLHNSLQELSDKPANNPLIEVRASVSQRWIKLEVGDNGQGMVDKLADRVGEPWQTNRQANGGLGLGLAYAKQHLVESFHGRFTVKTKYGQGTKIILSFPKVKLTPNIPSLPENDYARQFISQD